jgi:hypothetical protein
MAQAKRAAHELIIGTLCVIHRPSSENTRIGQWEEPEATAPSDYITIGGP